MVMTSPMRIPRRFLPPLPLLSAFEAAARLGSFTAAAQELDLTQGAVSRQIRALEDLIGTPLFHREKQRVRLTTAGENYAAEIREALKRIATATIGFRANPAGGTLNLAILPTFGVRWLAPRLPAFQQAHPGITINLHTRLNPFDFEFESIDAAIHYGANHWPGACTALLMTETVVPACSAAFRAAHGITSARDLTRTPLLHLASRPDAWDQWFRANGVAGDNAPGMLFDQFAMAAQGASAGLGVALLPRFLIERELASGELVIAIDRPMTSEGAYYLAWPPTREDYPPLAAFREWLVRETAGAAGQG